MATDWPQPGDTGACSEAAQPGDWISADELTLVQACLAGHRSAFDPIVERHRRRVYQVCRSLPDCDRSSRSGAGTFRRATGSSRTCGCWGPRTAGEPDDQILSERLAALREHDERAAQELRAAYAALAEVLTPRQQARFRLFEENIDARKLESLMRARARAGRTGS